MPSPASARPHSWAPGLHTLRRRWRRFVVLHRRGLLALLVGLAVLAGARAVSPPPAPTTSVLVATADLSGGDVLSEHDVALRDLPADATPVGALDAPAQAVGRVLAAPMRGGEVVTDLRVLDSGLLEAHPGSVAVPVTLPDAAVRSLLRVGDRVDLVAAVPRGAAAVVASAAPVLALPEPRADAPVGAAGALVVVAVPETEALDVVRASAAGVLGVVLLG